MLLDFLTRFNRLCTALWPQPVPPPALPDPTCPLAHPDALLPDWVARDPVVQTYRALLGDLPWHQFPERSTQRNWPGPQPDPRAPFVAAFLIQLHQGKRFMSQLRTYRGMRET